jgi:hypothetical protein
MDKDNRSDWPKRSEQRRGKEAHGDFDVLTESHDLPRVMLEFLAVRGGIFAVKDPDGDVALRDRR